MHASLEEQSGPPHSHGPDPRKLRRMAMFSSVLIANRGEIACRVIRTARRLGMRTIAVLFGRRRRRALRAQADEAYRIGPAPARESYLVGEHIIEVRASRPGRPASIPATASSPRTPISPKPAPRPASSSSGRPPKAIRAMGLKDAAKALVERAGVPVVPGYHGDEAGACVPARAGRQHRLSRAHQGRRGRRRQGHAPGRPADRFRGGAAPGCQREAASAFGDPRVLVEKYVRSPRHVEMQVFADGHGNVGSPVRARLLAAAPPPEGDRGSARAGHDRRRCARRWARPPSMPRARWAMSARARSSSSRTPARG